MLRILGKIGLRLEGPIEIRQSTDCTFSMSKVRSIGNLYVVMILEWSDGIVQLALSDVVDLSLTVWCFRRDRINKVMSRSAHRDLIQPDICNHDLMIPRGNEEMIIGTL